jgi:3-hydroxybutyryl-CoA dehydratase
MTDVGHVANLKEGHQLPGLTKTVTQEKVKLYAQASRDFNPIHVDEAFARRTTLGGTVAHGMLILAYVSEMMTAAFGRDWLTGGRLDVRFKAAARPGETIAVSGQIAKLEKAAGSTTVRCSVLCSNSKGETVISGEASVTLRSST